MARLVREGIDAMSEGRHELALDRFTYAATQNPRDALAVFMQGAALNRLGRHETALVRVESAARMGLEHREHAFELGWAQLGSGRYAEAIEQLEWFDQAYPGRGQTREFLGRARFHLGDLDAAQADLHQALLRDASLRPTAGVYLALIEQRRGHPQAAREHLRAISNEPEQGPVSDLLGRYTQSGRGARRTRTGVVAPESAFQSPPDKRWRLNVTLGSGWNDNVVASADDFPLPTDISDKGSAFGRFTASGAYDLMQTRQELLTAGFAFGANIYENGLDDSDLLDSYGFVTYHRRLGDRWVGTLRGSQQYTFVGGSSFRNRLAVSPAVGVRLMNALAAEFSYSFASSTYFFTATPVTDRDGESHTVTGSLHWRPTELPLGSRIGYFYGINDTDGRDFDNSTRGIFGSLKFPLPAGITGNLTYTHIFENYDHNNSFTTPTPFGRRRHDDVDIVSLQVSRKIHPKLAEKARVYVRYDFTNNDSNVAFFDYEQNVISAGVIIHY